MSNPNVALIQRGLAGLGHDPGAADGMFGPRTAAAGQAWLAAGGKARPVAPVPGVRLFQGRAEVREIVIHCAATRPEWYANITLATKRAEIRRWHLARGFSDIGYHWLIDRDGKVMAGRMESIVGSHVKGRNTGTLGVCLIGGHGSATSDPFAENFTPEQDAALRRLIREIQGRANIQTISGHSQYANKACPGFEVDKWLRG